MINDKAKKGKAKDFRPKYKKCRKCCDRTSCTAMCIDACLEAVIDVEVKKAKKVFNDIDDYEAKRSMQINERTKYKYKGRKRR